MTYAQRIRALASGLVDQDALQRLRPDHVAKELEAIADELDVKEQAIDKRLDDLDKDRQLDVWPR